MNNIFQNAHFGKSYRTRDGRKAIYTMMSCDSHWLAIQDTSFTWEYNDNGELVSNIDNAMDIVSEWKEPIDEEELDKLAEHEYPYEYYTSLHGEEEAEYKDALREAFKAGCRKVLSK